MAATDTFGSGNPTRESPPRGGAAITPSDSLELAYVTKAIYVGVTGNIKVKTADGTTLTFYNVPVGQFVIAAKQVFATDTTATYMVAQYG